MGRSYRVNCGWVERLNANSAVERATAIAGFFELKSTQRLCGWPFLHSDDRTVVLNVKDDARVGQKMASARGHRCLALDLIDKTLPEWPDPPFPVLVMHCI